MAAFDAREAINWRGVFNRLFAIINQPGETYYSGGRYLRAVQEVDPDCLSYDEYIQQRRAAGRSTSRQDYYYDILTSLDEPRKIRLVTAILREVERHEPARSAELRAIMAGAAMAPAATIDDTAWNAERLNTMLAEIDASIAGGAHERAVALGYTCLEGFYATFLHRRQPAYDGRREIVAMARAVRDVLRGAIPDYPDEILNLLTQVTHAVDRARNRFSEAHFGGEAGLWLATYVRDLVNTQIRLLLHFM
jgi:hypothetical protein